MVVELRHGSGVRFRRRRELEYHYTPPPLTSELPEHDPTRVETPNVEGDGSTLLERVEAARRARDQTPTEP